MKRRLLALVILALPFLLAPSDCGKPDPRVCQACALCVENPAQQGCAQLLASGICEGCGTPVPVPTPLPTPTPPPTTTQPPAPPTTTQPPVPVPTPTPTPIPPLAGCRAPQGSWIDPQPAARTLQGQIKAVIVALSGCNDGSDCPLENDNLQSWQERVIAELRARGLCSGMHEDGVSDEITVAPICTARWEGYRVFGCTPPVPSDPPTDCNEIPRRVSYKCFDTCPVIGRGKVRWAFPTLGYVPAASCASPPPTPIPPTPSPAPSPTPSPIPPAVACPLQWPVPEPYVLEMRIGPHGSSGQQYDATPYIKGPSSAIPPPGWTGSCRTQQCDLSPEKDPQHGTACTVQLCGAELHYRLVPSLAGVINWVNGYTVKVTLTGPAMLMATCPVSGIVSSRSIP